MVSLTRRQDLADVVERDSHLRSLKLLLDGVTPIGLEKDEGDVRSQLLSAISTKDPMRFQAIAGEIGRRRIAAESDWCHDDYLLFLLLLGNEKFGKPLSFLPNVIETRRANANPVPRKINEVFAALEREEYGIEGEFGFLKIPFLHVLGKLRLTTAEARKALQALSAPGLLDAMPPFLRLLTQKAHDLVLLERQPIQAETASQLIEALEKHAKDLSLRDWWRVIAALPGRIIWAIVLAMFALGLMPVLFGLGTEIARSARQEARSRPLNVAIAEVGDPRTDLAEQILHLGFDPQRKAGGRGLVSVAVDAVPFDAPTSAFVVEASHPTKPIRTAFAYTQDSRTPKSAFTVVPVQRDSSRFRAILPEQPKGHRLRWLLQFEAEADESAQSIGTQVVLRSLP